MKSKPISNFSKQLKKGLDSTIKKLVKYEREVKGSLVFSENGKIVKIKADKIKL